ncbi:flagellar hook protein FlgE [Hyphococcus sp.]|uniref:flagellar hook protein FlgE n=1 Tax=Hyphococcus sp. TaxID=2038636 RepID=UPI003D0A3610
MSIGSALQAGVSGLKALSTRLATISDNIANSSTVGYKRYDTQFSSLVINGGARGAFSAGGASTVVRADISRNGGIVGSDVVTDLAIGGNGFFTVSSAAAGGDFALTRAGSFRPDETGALRNASGFYLQGFALNPDGTYANGAPSLTNFTSLQTVNIGAINGTARASTAVSFVGNVPQNSAGPFETGIQYYDEFGGAQNLTLNWVNTGPNVWDLEVYDGPVAGPPLGTLTGIDFNAGVPGAPNYGGAAVGGAAGALNAAAGTFDVTLPTGQVINVSIGAEDTFNGVTQFAGDYNPETFADGAALGELEAIDINEQGIMIAVFSTGERRPIYEIPLADVVNPDGLTPQDGNVFTLSASSGALTLNSAGNGVGEVNAGALEGANVDIATELTSLIETQRAYSSNATVVRTADEMLEEVTRLKR